MQLKLEEKNPLPLVRLNLATAFLDAALSASANVDALLKPYGVSTLAFTNADIFVPATTMYDVVETLSEATGDPYIGVHLGAQLDPFQWSPLAQAAKLASSVGELLLRFSIDAQKDANSVVYRLETMGSRASFTEQRVSTGGRTPRHNDGFGAAYLLNILRAATGSAWDGRQVVTAVCDPSVFPHDYLNLNLAQGDTQGFTIAFPCEWLLLPPHLEQTQNNTPLKTTAAEVARTPLEALHHVLLANLHDQNLSSERVASLVGVSKRTLARRVAGMGTSLKTEIDVLRQKQAERELSSGHQTIAAIGTSVGYPDSSVFIRAFKRWTGMTPKQFRELAPYQR
ncbi:MAG: helix-turn-helix domain-containing protein [Halioglobus sp.]